MKTHRQKEPERKPDTATRSHDLDLILVGEGANRRPPTSAELRGVIGTAHEVCPACHGVHAGIDPQTGDLFCFGCHPHLVGDRRYRLQVVIVDGIVRDYHDWVTECDQINALMAWVGEQGGQWIGTAMASCCGQEALWASWSDSDGRRQYRRVDAGIQDDGVPVDLLDSLRVLPIA